MASTRKTVIVLAWKRCVTTHGTLISNSHLLDRILTCSKSGIFEFPQRSLIFCLRYTIGVTPGIPVQFVTVGKTGTGNGFLDTITTMIAQPNVPEVVTTSYGQIEEDVDVDVAEYVSRILAMQQPSLTPLSQGHV